MGGVTISAYPDMQTATAQTTVETEAALLRKHERLIRYMALPFSSRGGSLDDIMQEGRLALLSASRTWEASYGVKLWTYARKFVLGAMIRFVSDAAEEPSRPSDPRYDEDDEIQETAHDNQTPEDALSHKEQVAIMVSELAHLSENERRAVRLSFNEGLDIRSIATSLGVPRSTAHDILQGAIAKLRERVGAKL
jgi:RNA polymerase sigma factor (sigma-70 family)